MKIPQFWPPEREPRPVSSTRRKKLILSYLPDWILTIVLAAVFFALDSISGFRRDFSLVDTSIRHPYAVKERVSTVDLVLICLVAPLVLQPIINFFTVRSYWDLHNSILGLVLGLALSGAITQFSKVTVGRPRPDLIDRCQPPAGSVDPTFGLTSWKICTQTDAFIMKDGFRSLPSGHASLSFAGLGFLSFYLAGKLHLFDGQGFAHKAWMSAAPLCGAALVAISRTMDYRHHWHDVVLGSLLGLLTAYFAYRQFYPPLTSDLCHLPHSPRIKREQTDSFLPVHDHHPPGGAEGRQFHDEDGALEMVNGTVPRKRQENIENP